MTTTALDAPARPQDRVIKRPPKQRDWAKWGLGAYFALFLVFLYGPMIVMAILSLQGYYGGVTFPFRGPLSLSGGARSSIRPVVGNADPCREIHTRRRTRSASASPPGVIVSILAFTLSMAFRRRWRFRTDGSGST